MTFDIAFFKKLSNNDTGSSLGHQGGIVVPVDLTRFLPRLSRRPDSPTADCLLSVELRNEGNTLGNVETRYQMQTWGGERRPEYRITGNLSPLRSIAKGGDLLVFERVAGSLEQFRLTLIPQESNRYAQVLRFASADRRWDRLPLLSANGLDLYGNEGASCIDVLAERDALRREAEKPFELFEKRRRRINLNRTIARSAAFSQEVRHCYEYTCAVSRVCLTDAREYEVEAAHIIPVGSNGPDDIRNGIALCRTMHWAFDRGLITISADRKVKLSSLAQREPCCGYLAQFDSMEVLHTAVMPAEEALAWHRKHVFLKG